MILQFQAKLKKTTKQTRLNVKAEAEECVGFYFKKGRQTEDTQGKLRARAAADALEFKLHLKIQVSYLSLNV